MAGFALIADVSTDTVAGAAAAALLSIPSLVFLATLVCLCRLYSLFLS